MKSGMIVIDKEAGYTSFDVVAKLRGILHEKKIGHMGTLDPMATGVLPVCVGKATKLIDVMEDHDKSYRAVMTLGIMTDTYDVTGQILSQTEPSVTEEEVTRELLSMQGSSLQKPPMYSAVSVGGKRLYDLARKGQTVEVPLRPIEIYRITVEEICLPDVTFSVSCSRGTYIRSLVYDVGQKLGCGATLKSLRRTSACGFCEQDAVSLTEVAEAQKAGRLEELFIPIEKMLGRFLCLYGDAEITNPLVNGAHIHNFNAVRNEGGVCLTELIDEKKIDCKSRVCLYTEDGRLCGLYELCDRELKLIKFLL